MAVSFFYVASWYLCEDHGPGNWNLLVVFEPILEWLEPIVVFVWTSWLLIAATVAIQMLLWLVLEVLLFPKEYAATLILIMTPLFYIAAVLPALQNLESGFKKRAQATIRTILFGLLVIFVIVLWAFAGLWLLEVSSTGLGGFGPAVVGVIGAVTSAINAINGAKKASTGVKKAADAAAKKAVDETGRISEMEEEMGINDEQPAASPVGSPADKASEPQLLTV